jgi:NSS family neurotransmitter:Na+ symporter
VFALAAAAVGLGNVWRFAYLLGENGGAPFMAAYVLCLLTLAAPLLIAEVVVGAIGRGAPLQGLARGALQAHRSRLWSLLALPACLAALLLLAMAMLVAAWSLLYAYQHQLGGFAAISISGTRRFFETLLTQPLRSLGWLALALSPLVCFSALGVRRGLGVLMWLCVPLMVVLLAVLIRYALDHGDLAAAGKFLFARQPLDFTDRSFLLAAGQAFFTLGIGVGVGLTFGAYAPGNLPICRSVLAVALFDVVIAVAVGVAVFPLLFAANLAPAQGFGLLFIALPYAFGNLNLGDFFGTLFFFSIYVVTLVTSAVLAEPLVCQLHQFGLRRGQASVLALGLAALLAAIALHQLSAPAAVSGLVLSVDTLVGLLVPLSAVLMALYVGWRLPRGLLRKTLQREPDFLFSLWYFLLRFWVPPALIFLWLALRVTETI